jgi:hypothetical protein
MPQNLILKCSKYLLEIGKIKERGNLKVFMFFLGNPFDISYTLRFNAVFEISRVFSSSSHPVLSSVRPTLFSLLRILCYTPLP